ncbi:hypothetical protein N7462_001837 [Penicillium macrosclerotiorum]|uniref:uncharacterized protein n=1 Tax=Penicillium macrosclerotiorum TaxID=303699 RepID=UPI0025477FB2|nr:uncharacterized protein N7462_001837 [Penicillium macrosclerotiorum]KAJ5692414.1 hypothetical protein N7462_001837 [Penicillium macrosclerotiorum]
MRLSSSLLATGALWSLASATASPETEPPLKNANHIFNTIYDSMRQWGSSLHHNGVSFFLASVPAGTQFYHGTSKSSPVNGTEWLAFEPEHALMFARPHHGPPPRHPGDDEGDHREDGPGGPERSHDELRRRQPHGPEDGHHEMPPLPPFEALDESEAGYLHTYVAAKDLRLLYIDGMSAAKTNKGTLESQDVLLFNNTLDDSPQEGEHGPPGEFQRAVKACELAKNEWGGRIDGVIRMEAGFEIILCAFERDLTPIRISQVKSDPQGRWAKGRQDRKHGGPPGSQEDDRKRRGPGGPGGPGRGPDLPRWMRAVTSRYDGIGGGRVILNYDHFVTAYAYDLDLFPDNSSLPRLAQLSHADVEPIQKDLTALVLAHDAGEASWNWQATADMIVTRYSQELSYMASGKFSDLESLQNHLEVFLSPFIDYSERDTALEARRCATQFLPLEKQDATELAGRAVYSVANSICSTLLAAWEAQELESAVEKIQILNEYLGWATWKKCRGCEDNEVCVVPIWPMGTVADYENPRCKDLTGPVQDPDGESYWGGLHP